jgi:hypothetical protein
VDWTGLGPADAHTARIDLDVNDISIFGQVRF